MAPQGHDDSGEQPRTDNPIYTCEMCDTEVERHISFCSEKCSMDSDRYTPEPDPEPWYDDRMDPRRDHPSSWNNLQ
jgi:hypothetical protein